MRGTACFLRLHELTILLFVFSLGDKLTIPLPEIVFGNNYVSLKRSSTEQALSFNTVNALETVDKTGQDNIKVAYAATWAKSRKLDSSADAVIETVKNFDWTYSTDYAGTSSDGLVSLVLSRDYILTPNGPGF